MIIGISGKKQSGKNTVAKIWQLLDVWYNTEERTNFDEMMSDTQYVEYMLEDDKISYNKSSWQQKSFAHKLKQITCILLKCTMEQLEDPEFKEKELGEEWIRYGYADGFTTDNNGNKTMIFKECDKERYEIELRINWQTAYKIHYTPRMLLQAIGTDLFRNQLLDNIWINALMSEYKPREATLISKNCPRQDIYSLTEEDEIIYGTIGGLYPNWIISDVRFFNEAKTIKDRGGILIRVERDSGFKDSHVSENALNTYKDWNYVIDNNYSLLELILKVRQIMFKEGIIYE